MYGTTTGTTMNRNHDERDGGRPPIPTPRDERGSRRDDASRALGKFFVQSATTKQARMMHLTHRSGLR